MSAIDPVRTVTVPQSSHRCAEIADTQQVLHTGTLQLPRSRSGVGPKADFRAEQYWLGFFSRPRGHSVRPAIFREGLRSKRNETGQA